MPEALLREIVPAEYHNAGYLKDLLDKDQKTALPEVFKKLQHAESLVGKKTGLPGADASDADWDSFLKTLRPNSAEEYQFGDKDKIDPTFLKVVQESFLEGGIHAKQAAKFMGKYRAGMADYVKGLEAKKSADKVKADQAFEELAKTGGQDKTKLDFARKLITENTPEAFKPYVDKLDNNALVILSAVLNGVAEKYMGEDELNARGKGASSPDGGKTKRAEALEQMKKVNAMKGFEPDYDEQVKKLNQLYIEAAAESKK